MSDSFNDYMELVAKKAKEWAGIVADRTVQGYDLGKNEYEIQKTKREMERAYKTLGKLSYQIEIGTLQRDERIVAAAVKQITLLQEKLDDLTANKADIKARQVGPNKNAAPAEEEDEADDEPVTSGGYAVMKFCPKCRVGNNPNADKCINCGYEFK